MLILITFVTEYTLLLAKNRIFKLRFKSKLEKALKPKYKTQGNHNNLFPSEIALTDLNLSFKSAEHCLLSLDNVSHTIVI